MAGACKHSSELTFLQLHVVLVPQGYNKNRAKQISCDVISNDVVL